MQDNRILELAYAIAETTRDKVGAIESVQLETMSELRTASSASRQRRSTLARNAAPRANGK